MLFHITYRDRVTGRIETGSVFVLDSVTRSASQLRSDAIRAAGFKFPTARRGTIRIFSSIKR